jgi:hypothetical protein
MSSLMNISNYFTKQASTVVVIVLAAWLLNEYINTSWHFMPALSHKDFDETAPYNKKEIPTTYYKAGKLIDVLPKVVYKV